MKNSTKQISVIADTTVLNTFSALPHNTMTKICADGKHTVWIL